MLRDSCLVFAPAICATWDDTVQFWELLATVTVTAFAAGLTIWISVRESRRATDRALRADADRRRREEERAAVAGRQAQVEQLLLGFTASLFNGIGIAFTIRTVSPAWYAATNAIRMSTEPNATDLADWAHAELHGWHEDMPYNSEELPEWMRERLLVPEMHFGQVAREWAADPHSILHNAERDKVARESYLAVARFTRTPEEEAEAELEMRRWAKRDISPPPSSDDP